MLPPNLTPYTITTKHTDNVPVGFGDRVGEGEIYNHTTLKSSVVRQSGYCSIILYIID